MYEPVKKRLSHVCETASFGVRDADELVSVQYFGPARDFNAVFTVFSAGSMERILNWTAINEMLFSVIGLPLLVPLPS